MLGKELRPSLHVTCPHSSRRWAPSARRSNSRRLLLPLHVVHRSSGFITEELVLQGGRLPAPPPAQTAQAQTPESSGDSGTITICYHSSWPSGVIHGSVHGADWRDYPLLPVTSAPGKWLQGALQVTGPGLNGNGAQPALEFVITDGHSQWDKPLSGANYLVHDHGRYVVRGGALQPVTGEAVLLVSDLDGTMVGDDAATAAFRTWWEERAVVRGSSLVYNTGRSLESFQRLQSEKAHCLARPDVLISSVGTKVYNFEGGRAVEDQQWVALLDKGWSVDIVRDAAYSALAKVGKDVMHFRPPDEQNQHKVTCGVHMSVLESVLDHLQAALEKGDVDANLITSGTGDWRFLDIVSRQAGKLEALEYVRRSKGFPVDRTVACGDSGNDILMLSGANLALVVGNAQPDLVSWVASREQEEEPQPNGVPRLLVAAKHEAFGILEGLDFWGLS